MGEQIVIRLKFNKALFVNIVLVVLLIVSLLQTAGLLSLQKKLGAVLESASAEELQ